jgi:hypothetical protein
MNEVHIGMGSFLPAAFEAIGKLTPPDELSNLPGLTTLTALRAAFPEYTKFSILKEKQHRIDFFYAFNKLGIAINDHEDLLPYAQKSNNSTLQESLTKGILLAKNRLNEIIQQSPQEDQKGMKENVESYIQEIQFLEHSVRENPQNVKDIISYRELMNAINIIHYTKALLGSSIEISTIENGRLQNTPTEKLSRKFLNDKYAWLIQGKYAHVTEKKLGALYNIVMGMQVIDDEIDVHADDQIDAPNIARCVAENNPDSTKILHTLRDHYFSKAKQAGVSYASIISIKDAFIIMKKVMSKKGKSSREQEHTMIMKNIFT